MDPGNLRLEMSSSLIEAGKNDEEGRGDKHQDGEEGVELEIRQLRRSIPVHIPGIETRVEKIAGSDSEKP